MTPPTAVATMQRNCDQILKQLKAMGTAQNRKVYARHGAPPAMFGVSYANLGKLKKQIKADHDLAHNLAMQLWDTGILDAQVLATMICDPGKLKKSDCDRWVKESTCHQLTGAVAGAVARSPHALSRYEKWRKARPEFTQTAAWSTLAGIVKHNPEAVNEPILIEAINRIETTIHTAPNRARESMNTCLICIGTYRDDLRKAAIAAAIRIGNVEIDHGETGCKTSDAVAYIRRAAARKGGRR